MQKKDKPMFLKKTQPEIVTNKLCESIKSQPLLTDVAAVAESQQISKLYYDQFILHMTIPIIHQ